MEPTPIHVQPLSYETPTEDFRPVVKVLAWSAIATGTFNFGAAAAAIFSSDFQGWQGWRFFWDDWRHADESVLVLGLLATTAAIVVSGILSLRPRRTARLLMMWGNTAFLVCAVPSAALQISDLLRLQGFPPILVAQSILGHLAYLMFPITLIGLLTRPPIRRAFER